MLRYAERLRSHDASLRDLAVRRERVYAHLVPLTPARLGRRRRADLLGGVVDDLTEVVEAQVRVTVPVVAAAAAGLLTAVLTAVLAPAAGFVIAGLVVVTALVGLLAERAEAAAQAEPRRPRGAAGLSRAGGARLRRGARGGLSTAVLDRVDAAHGEVERALQRQSRGPRRRPRRSSPSSPRPPRRWR